MEEALGAVDTGSAVELADVTEVSPAAPNERIDPRLPLVIGITGHRDVRPEAREELAECIREILLRLRGRYPHTPLLMVSPLAEGADRLVAEVALEPQIASRLIVPMPMPRALYERDFQTAESRVEFARLLGHASHSIELPLAAGITLEAARNGEQRQRQYIAVGEFVARHSQILIALWDGKTGAAGGTAQVVQLKLAGNCPNATPEASFDGIVPRGPVYHITTPRLRDGGSPVPIVSKEIYPEGEEEETRDFYHLRVFKPLDDYNREVGEGARVEAGVANQAATDLIPSLDSPALRDARSGLAAMRGDYAMADVFAGQYQARTVSALRWVSLIVFAAALGFDAALHLLLGESLEVLRAVSMFSSPVLMLVAVLFYRRAKRNDYQNKFQDYRGLAEGLRIQFFWRLAGLNECVADRYLGRHRLELEWIRNACRSSLVAAGCPLGPVNDETRKIIADNWVDPQRSYLQRAIAR